MGDLARIATADVTAAKIAATLGKHKLLGMSFVAIDDHVRSLYPGSDFESRADVTQALLTIQNVVRRTGANV